MPHIRSLLTNDPTQMQNVCIKYDEEIFPRRLINFTNMLAISPVDSAHSILIKHYYDKVLAEILANDEDL